MRRFPEIKSARFFLHLFFRFKPLHTVAQPLPILCAFLLAGLQVAGGLGNLGSQQADVRRTQRRVHGSESMEKRHSLPNPGVSVKETHTHTHTPKSSSNVVQHTSMVKSCGALFDSRFDSENRRLHGRECKRLVPRRDWPMFDLDQVPFPFKVSTPSWSTAGTPTRSPSSAVSHPFFGWEGSPTKIDYRKKGTLVLTSLLEDLAYIPESRSS